MTARHPAAPPPPVRWEEWFQRASPAQRAEALDLAHRQGVLYPHQLPPPANGAAPAAPADGPLARTLADLFTGKSDPLPPVPADPYTPTDPALDDMQREAVRRALATPDVCMIQGLPGTGKTRVVAEVLTQAAGRGWRALFVAPTAAPLDAALHRLVGRPDVLPIRFLDPSETPEALPAWLRGFTLAEQQQSFLERTLAGARQSVTDAEAVCRQRHQEAAAWPALAALADRAAALRQRLAELETAAASTGGDAEHVRAALAELDEQHAQALRDIAAAEAAQRDQKTTAEKERDELNRAVDELKPRHAAQQQGQWWSLTYWRAKLTENVDAEMAALVERRDAAVGRLGEIETELARLQNARLQRDEKHRADRASLLAAEADRGQQERTTQRQAVDAELRAVQAEGQPHCAELGLADLTPAAVAEVQADWQGRKAKDEEACRFAQGWAGYLEGAGPDLAGKLPVYATALVGTLASLDALAAASPTPADLLVVEEADRLTEAEILKLARHARRLVLVGPCPAENRDARVPDKAPRSLSGLAPLAPACWSRLWHALGGDGGRLPYAWRRDDDRLVCQLAPVAPEERDHLESEPLADDPAVELRILTRPKAKPCLAEVAFPADTPLPAAFARIVREVGDVPLAPLCRSPWWHFTDGGPSWHCGPAGLAPDLTVAPEPGVRVGFRTDGAGAAWKTVRVDFDRDHGWDAGRALAWLRARLPARDAGRTAVLQVPYRCTRPLARAVGDLLFPDDSLWPLLADQTVAREPALEFVAVPPPRKPELPREGAGLELDLSAPRHADRLPAELRAGLPTRGFVNYLEAQAVVRRLEQLAPTALPAAHDGRPTVAVIALYAGQAELLRRLIDASDVLRSRPFSLEAGVPADFREREVDVALVSLTRSHAHRCVPFGDDAADLPLALTRARSRLVLFGDPGTLHKRVGWTGPLDHLGAHAAGQERARLARLVRHLQETQRPAGQPHLCNT